MAFEPAMYQTLMTDGKTWSEVTKDRYEFLLYLNDKYPLADQHVVRKLYDEGPIIYAELALASIQSNLTLDRPQRAVEIVKNALKTFSEKVDASPFSVYHGHTTHP